MRNGLQIAGNFNDAYAENVKVLRDEFNKMKEATLRSFDLYELRLKAIEDMVSANTRFVSSVGGALRVEKNAVSIEEEQLITELPDYDHN